MPYDITVGRNKEDKKELGDRGLLMLGKGYVKMGQYTSLSNKIFMDVAKSHVVLVAGKRGSGKSYTLGVMAEEISNLPKEVSQNIGTLMFDTMGIYWTMKYANEKDRVLLREWGLQGKNLPVKIFVPFGHYDEYVKKGIPVDESFALDAMEMNPEDWILMFGLDMINPVSVAIQKALNTLVEKGDKYIIKDIIHQIESDHKSSQENKIAAAGLFEAADTWGVFAKEDHEPTPVEKIITGGVTSVLDLSIYNSVGAFNVRALVISLLSRKLFNQRMIARKEEEIKAISKGFELSGGEEKKDYPLVWLFIDEAHEFLPLKEKTVATDALVQLLREGRQPGISVVLATQQPGKIHTDVMTQSDIVLAHRVTSKPDVDALNHIMQSYLLNTIKEHMDNLPSLKGSCIVLDDNSERIYPMRMRPRFTWHGGEAPTAVKREKKL